MRRTLTTRFVVVISVMLLVLCVGWAILVQSAVPDACSYQDPPPRAQYLHCLSPATDVPAAENSFPLSG